MAESRAVRTVLALDRAAERPWFPPAIGVFPLLDYALPFLPNQMLPIALSAARTRRWWSVALTFTAATALGALGIAWLLQALGGEWLANLRSAAEGESAARLVDWLDNSGVWLLTALALLPVPPRTGVIVCALAGLAPWSIGLAVALGRLFSAGTMAWLAAHSLPVLRRLPAIDRALTAIEAARVNRREAAS